MPLYVQCSFTHAHTHKQSHVHTCSYCLSLCSVVHYYMHVIIPFCSTLIHTCSHPINPSLRTIIFRSTSPSSEVNDDDVVHCVCGDETDEGFMIQVSTAYNSAAQSLYSFVSLPIFSVSNAYVGNMEIVSACLRTLCQRNTSAVSVLTLQVRINLHVHIFYLVSFTIIYRIKAK